MNPTSSQPRSPRRRRTRWSVWLMEHVSRVIVTVGGIGTIVAVTTVFLFLLFVVLPLFQEPEILDDSRVAMNWSTETPVQMGADENQLIGWALFRNGELQVFDLQKGTLIDKQKLFDAELTAWSFPVGTANRKIGLADGSLHSMSFGFADGTVQHGAIGFITRPLDAGDVSRELRNLAAGNAAPMKVASFTPEQLRDYPELEKLSRLKQGMLQHIEETGQLRLTELVVILDDPDPATTPSPVIKIDQSKTTSGMVCSVLSAGGRLRLCVIEEKENLETLEKTKARKWFNVPYTEPAGKGPPVHIAVSSTGNQLCLVWKDGHLQRFDLRTKKKGVVAEERNLLDDAALKVTSVCSLIGNSTFLVGDSSGRVKAWFFAGSPAAKTVDGGVLTCAHEFAGQGSPVQTIATSHRTRTAAIAYADRKVRLVYVTSNRDLAELSTNDVPTVLALLPKDDGLVAGGSGGYARWKYDPKHPEITPAALFRQVWYEGYDGPQHMWQSSGGNDAVESKFGLVPLILGTLKATFYALLFGVPLALLAAVYTSEFMNPRMRMVVKPTIELMASLPSVVLGFLAGLVIAQFVEGVVPAILTTLVTVPLAFVAGGYLWQLVPEGLSVRLARFRFLFIMLALPVGVAAGIGLGPVLEWAFFGGNLRAWLDGKRGSVCGGWFLLLLPLSGIACAVLMGRLVHPWLRRRTAGLTRPHAAAMSIGKFAAACVFTAGLAWCAGHLLGALGLDARDSFFGPYSQRNALVVGFVMGFAIIPIIYTLAEDALTAVPEHLRAGSLAAGATPWQTATRIIIPTAMSGLFSAVMIGMGRAVGETMIVLMAGGNTPVMDWNIFTGFRTLSANIATELPEAVRGSTHFRTLFLAALTLFAMTFVLNTVAEVVRLRFRRRAYQL